MTSLVNRYFNKASPSEQSLFNSIKTEAIKVMGRTFYYCPRQVQIHDLILGEDVLSKFSTAIQIEMYPENNNSFDGSRELFSKFGLEVHNNMTFVVSVDRWTAEIGKYNTGLVVNNRPQEGDLIYDPMTKNLMSITFVDHDKEFYQIGKNYLWHLTCESFQYNSEQFETGVQEIDNIDLGNSFDLLKNQLILETGGVLLIGDCDTLILTTDTDNETTMTYDKTEEFDTAADSLNWSVTNDPFSGA